MKRSIRSFGVLVGLSLALVIVDGPAMALPEVGAPRPEAKLEDAWERTLAPASLVGKPVLVVYEDKGSAKQNEVLKAELAELAKGDRYKQAIALLAVADVSSYNYWPVRGFVKDAIQEESRKQKTVIYCDWEAKFRVALGLRQGASNVVLYGKDGKVLFAHAGTLPTERRAELIRLLRKEADGDRSTALR